MKSEKLHEHFMRLALAEGKKGEGTTSPYPFVGCVIVKAGRVIARGHTQLAGKEHAEVNALKKLFPPSFPERSQVPTGTWRGRRATLYSTLEPCHHNDYSECEPCSQWIARSGVKTVVWGTTDPNPKNQSGSTRWLRARGIKVIAGVLEPECARLHEIFLISLSKRRPFVLLSTAVSLDGKITWRRGASPVNFSSAEAFARVHQLRSVVDAICVGIRTAEIDNPRLTARPKMFRDRISKHWKNPDRVIVDDECRLSPLARVFEAKSGRVFVLTTTRALKTRCRALERAGATIITTTPTRDGRVNLAVAFRTLYREHRITSLMIEGGGELIASALRAKLVDKLYFWYAPVLVGGRDTPTPVEGDALKTFSDAVTIKELAVEHVGGDILMSGYVQYGTSRPDSKNKS